MAQHKKRKPPQQQYNPPQKINAKRSNRVIAVVVIIFFLFGVGITFFAVGYDVVWLVAGGVIGAISGYVFGRQIVTGLLKNKP